MGHHLDRRAVQPDALGPLQRQLEGGGTRLDAQPGRRSTRSASDELWTMYWVMNLHEARGIHMHQYALPTSGPASHGCIRMLDPDAQWLYQLDRRLAGPEPARPDLVGRRQDHARGHARAHHRARHLGAAAAIRAPRPLPGPQHGVAAAGPVRCPARLAAAGSLRPPPADRLSAQPRELCWRRRVAAVSLRGEPRGGERG